MQSLFKFFVAIGLLSFASVTFAKPKDVDIEDYESNYYAAEGSILFKLRASGYIAKSKSKNFPEPVNNPSKPLGNFATNGYGIQASTTVFFTDNIGAELGLGLMVLKTSTSAMRAALINYGNDGQLLKRRDILGIPVDFLVQYHVAPFGAIRPYVGLGGVGLYTFTKSRAYKIGNAFGPAFQAGLDFVMRDDTVINIDVKRYNLTPKFTYTNSLLGPNAKAASGKLKIDPIVVSVGLGFKF